MANQNLAITTDVPVPDSSSKYHPVGWRIEQKYSPGVLIGNWNESRHGKVDS